MSVSYNFITERIATGGGIESKDDVSELVAHGITHVIDTRGCYAYSPACYAYWRG